MFSTRFLIYLFIWCQVSYIAALENKFTNNTSFRKNTDNEIGQFAAVQEGISLHLIKMHPKFHLRYAILVRKSKNVMITLQKYQENPIKISFCFQSGDKIVIYVSTRGHWDCTTLQHHCTTFGLTSDYTEVLSGWHILNAHGYTHR